MTGHVALDAIRNCLEGVIPAVIATCSAQGVPNIAYISQVHYVDNEHVALTFQFFNKTRENILVNPHAAVQVIDPDTAIHYRLFLEYLHTETAGPLFEHMKVKLAGIASHTGMAKVFRLLGADVYRVLRIENVYGEALTCARQHFNRLAALRSAIQQMMQGCDLDALFDTALRSLQTHFAIDHAMLLMFDPARQTLYTVASNGYETSGVGSEIPLGTGVIGVAARERTPIRIVYSTGEYSYSRAVRAMLEQSGTAADIETEIPFPGLAAPNSQLAVPIQQTESLFGMLYVESADDLRFTYEDEDALTVFGEQLALKFRQLQQAPEVILDKGQSAHPAHHQDQEPVIVRYYPADHSCFIDNDYLIKGVAGAIFAKLLRDYSQSQRIDFSNRELRLDSAIGLPDLSDNLEVRLILLQKRLAERCAYLRIEKTGRGRFRLSVERPIRLEEGA